MGIWLVWYSRWSQAKQGRAHLSLSALRVATAFGITQPEKRTAKASWTVALRFGPVRATPVNRDRYGRIVAIASAGGHDSTQSL